MYRPQRAYHRGPPLEKVLFHRTCRSFRRRAPSFIVAQRPSHRDREGRLRVGAPPSIVFSQNQRWQRAEWTAANEPVALLSSTIMVNCILASLSTCDRRGRIVCDGSHPPLIIFASGSLFLIHHRNSRPLPPCTTYCTSFENQNFLVHCVNALMISCGKIKKRFRC
ncbi:hypothetical protein B0H15DRAFT_429541 [Mycena belliarum]|uniref:Uncharacterized protein n=1 Tax=Mycena belliarum TaxID=1033014 RepID=A0AAD6XP25_9AGAR|nr:hypothetical protein B0H15DRAFT_429541 [Mycena belliae]